MKKLLLLGGSPQQVVAIETAKRLGCYTVLCDSLPDHPGQYAADRFCLVSTTDREAVLDVARREAVDGIVAYASDPAAPTAAYVAGELGLPGNAYETVRMLCNKDLFKDFLRENGFNVPGTRSFGPGGKVSAGGLSYPIVVKPCDSSGSKGVTVVRDEAALDDAVEFAFSHSRCKRIVAEEYIEKAHPYLIGGDIFVENGRVVMWGLMNCHRDGAVNPLVPVGKSYPLLIDEADERLAKRTLQELVVRSGFSTGAMNVELIIDRDRRCWLIDIGPRSGGNMIPDLLGLIFGVDVVEMTIRAALGMPLGFPEELRGAPFYATHNLHASRNGIYRGTQYSPEIRRHIVRECVYKKPGDSVEYFDNAAKALGIVFFRFDSREEMRSMLDDINRHIKILVS